MATQTLSKVHAVSFGKIYGLIGAVLGFLFGLVWGLVALVSSAALRDTPFAALGALGAILLPILGALFYGVISFIGGVITAWIYNIIAKIVGGVKIDLE